MAKRATKFDNVHIGGTLTVDGAQINNNEISADLLFLTNKKAQFRDTGIYINSGADGKITITADGSGSDDITLDGTVSISDDMLLATTKKVQFRDTGLYIQSGADGKLTISADGTGDDDVTVSGSLKVTEGMQAAAVARTATADGTGTGTIAPGTSYVTVTAGGDANAIIVLPPPVVGNVIWLFVGATGYELRTSSPATISINGGSGVNAESAIPANTLVRMVCVSATAWIGTQFAADGTVSAVEPAA